MSDSVQFIESKMFGPLKEKAQALPRLRTNYNFHSGNEDNPHRFLNVLARGTYVPPHRHFDPLKSETFLLLEGKAGLLLFDDQGKVTLAEVIGEDGRLGVDIPAGAWHTLVALSPYVVLFEVKAGPYVGRADKNFPAWAPHEGEAEAGDYLERMLGEFPV
jgi:cupin fold WbuC family metalloprotein